MKFLSMLAMVFCGAMLIAGTDVDVNGKFIGSQVGDLAPKKWTFNRSIKPVGTGKVVKVGDEFGVQISNPERAVSYFSGSVKVVPGEQYEVSCDVTGTGSAYLAMYFYNANGWVGAVRQPAVVLKAGEKNELKYVFTVPSEMVGKVPSRASFAFYAGPATEAVYTDFEVEKNVSK